MLRAVAGDREVGDYRVALWLVDVAERDELHRVPADGERVAGSERPLRFGRARLARRDRERDEHDAEMHDVATVAAPVAAEQAHERGHAALVVQGPPRAHAARELLDDRRRHEAGE